MSLRSSRDDVLVLSQAAYIKQAEEAWETAWKLFHDDSGWKVKEGKDLEHGKVFTKSQEPIGTVHKLEVYYVL